MVPEVREVAEMVVSTVDVSPIVSTGELADEKEVVRSGTVVAELIGASVVDITVTTASDVASATDGDVSLV